MLTTSTVARTGLDAIALKPAECPVSRALDIPAETITIDYEGREHLPDTDTLEALVADAEVRLTTPVRADGFDPLGDNSRLEALPDEVNRVLVAGHPAYLTDEERRRAVAPRLSAASRPSQARGRHRKRRTDCDGNRGNAVRSAHWSDPQ